jgi:hypothetical protein
MMFRRLRSSPRKFIGFRAAALVLGLVYVLTSTNTVQTIEMVFDLINKLGEQIQAVSGTTPRMKEQEKDD